METRDTGCWLNAAEGDLLVVIDNFQLAISKEFFMPLRNATTDEDVGGALRAAILLADKTCRGRRWDSASHVR